MSSDSELETERPIRQLRSRTVSIDLESPRSALRNTNRFLGANNSVDRTPKARSGTILENNSQTSHSPNRTGVLTQPLILNPELAGQEQIDIINQNQSNDRRETEILGEQQTVESEHVLPTQEELDGIALAERQTSRESANSSVGSIPIILPIVIQPESSNASNGESITNNPQSNSIHSEQSVHSSSDQNRHLVVENHLANITTPQLSSNSSSNNSSKNLKNG